jgi:hypothetical protein
VFLDWESSNTTVKDNWIYNSVSGAVKVIWKGNRNIVNTGNISSNTVITPPFVAEVGPAGTATNGIDLTGNKFTGSIIHYTDVTHFASTGTWAEDTAVGIVNLFEFDFLTGTVAVPSAAVYTLPITEDGTYEISLLYKPGADRASNVPIAIKHAQGKADLTWNMQQGSSHGFAVPIATYRFKAAEKSTVTLSTTGANGKVIADSVAFVKVGDHVATGPADQSKDKAPPATALKGILIDERDAERVGDWEEGNTNPVIPPGYLHDQAEEKGKKSLTFKVRVKSPGNYTIKLLYPAHPNRSTNTPVRVTVEGQTQEFKVNQRQSDGAGFVLGKFFLNESATVVVATQNTSGYVVVDGLQLIAQ